MAENVLPFADALSAVLEQAAAVTRPAATQALPLRDVAGRVLAEPLRAARDQPPFDRSTRDGYAVCLAQPETAWRVLGTLHAGEAWRGPALQAGEAVEIMTGAPVPAGAGAVLMVEHVTQQGDTIALAAGRSIAPGDNIVARGAEAGAGATLLPAGRRLHAAEIAIAASANCTTLQVFDKPKVAILSTGDELVELGEPLEPWQIVNSNSHGLVALVEAEGGIAGRLPIARDTRDSLRERIAMASLGDLMLLSGGVSMGKRDFVEEVLAAFGAEFFFTGALIQPGKPIVFGRLPKRGAVAQESDAEWTGEWTYFFGLPGNPISAQVCFHLFAAPLLRALSGQGVVPPRFVEARLAEAVKGGAKVTRFLPAELVSAWDAVTVRVLGWHGSGDLTTNARANGYCVLPAGNEDFPAGATVRVLLR